MVCSPRQHFKFLTDDASKLRRLRFHRSRTRSSENQAPKETSGPASSDQKQSDGSADDGWDRNRNTSSATPPHTVPRSSLVPQTSGYRGPSSSPDRKARAFGLQVIFQPEHVAPLDIVFVHGLGGHFRNTWCKHHDPSLFWPQLWLPQEPHIKQARILSFGYNANYGVGARSSSNIIDFAKELLYEMRFGRDDNGEDLGIGKVPIMFVAHSMGGLVVKKAYLLGQIDEEYQAIAGSISAIIFLATPHRGTNLAKVLTKVLTASLQSPKQFIAELNRNSSALEELNEQFRHAAPRLSIVSFYESLPTSVGPIKMMVLEKESSILGYPKEISRALNADHHTVCKYSSPEDPNYVSVCNLLKSLVERFRSRGVSALRSRTLEEANEIERVFAISSDAENDLNYFRQRWMPGTCDWLINEPEIQLWLEVKAETRIVWFSAPPGSGKSVLSSHVVSHLCEAGMLCQYFFFRASDQSKCSPLALMWSIADQVARAVPAFKRDLMELSAEGPILQKADYKLVWQKVFESILFKLDLSRPLYWVIDALDESESSEAFLELLRSLTGSLTYLRILIVSRKTERLILAFNQLSGYVTVRSIEKYGHDHNSSDIRIFAEKEINHMRGNNELKQRVVQEIMNRAEGNFLWVRLVLEEIVNCHTEEAIQETLDEIPGGLSRLYQRMELAILENARKANKVLAKALLQWIICAHRPLTLNELAQALRPEFTDFIDLRRTVQDVCGQFVVVDHAGKVGILHPTAREYLLKSSNTEIAVDLRRSHGQLFAKTVSNLLDPGFRFKLMLGHPLLRRTDPFVLYAATSWMYHLRHTDQTSEDFLDILVKLFKSSSVLVWIHLLALINQLEVLVKAAKTLSRFVATKRKLNAVNSPMLRRLLDLELLELWAIDLVKVVGKFSRHLLSDPSAIYKLVPPVCPKESVLHRQFHQPEKAELIVSGISNTVWNDNLARYALPNGDQAWNIACASQYVAVLGSSGSIFLGNAYNLTEVCTLRHNESVIVLSPNKKGNKLVSYGLRSTKLWSLPSGQLLSTIPNPNDSKAMAIAFTENDQKILIGSDDRKIRSLQTNDFGAGWHELNAALLRENSQIDNAFVNSPMCVAFNGDATQVGVSYRGYPLSVWALNESRCINRCRRADQVGRGPSQATWFAVDRFVWNPVSGHIIGLYRDGCIFKWHPITAENVEVRSVADEVAASPDGKLFVTSNSDGTVRVWNFTYMTIIYQLSSTDLVTGLAFSPDSQRFYDLRGSSVNSWEPNSLIRFSETEDASADRASEVQISNSLTQASEAGLMQYEAVSALAVPPSGSLFCIGKEDGVVELVDAPTGESIEIGKFPDFFGVSHFAWGEDGRLLIAADLGNNIIAQRLVLPERKGSIKSIEIKPDVSPKIDLDGRGIHQMLFSPDSKSLLIITDDRGFIWATENCIVKSSVILERGTARRWLQHPISNGLFLGFGVDDVKVYRWLDFAELPRLSFQEERRQSVSQSSVNASGPPALDLAPHPNARHDLTSSVIEAMLTQDGKHVLVQIKDVSLLGRVTKSLLIFAISAFAVGDDGDQVTALLNHSYIPPDIAAKVDIPLGILPGAQLTFLDQDLWIYTVHISRLGSMDANEAPQRHYFVPRDWISSEYLGQSRLLKDGTFLCVVGDKVAIMKGSLGFGGF